MAERITSSTERTEEPRRRRRGWLRGFFDLVPMHDGRVWPGTVSLTPSAEADLGRLASIELQLKDDRLAESDKRTVRSRLDLVPLYDRPVPISLSPSANGPITTLARVELNARNGRPPEEGLEDPDQLNQPGAP